MKMKLLSILSIVSAISTYDSHAYDFEFNIKASTPFLAAAFVGYKIQKQIAVGSIREKVNEHLKCYETLLKTESVSDDQIKNLPDPNKFREYAFEFIKYWLYGSDYTYTVQNESQNKSSLLQDIKKVGSAVAHTITLPFTMPYDYLEDDVVFYCANLQKLNESIIENKKVDQELLSQLKREARSIKINTYICTISTLPIAFLYPINALFFATA